MVPINLKDVSAGGTGNSPGGAKVEPLLPGWCPASVLAPAVVVYAAKLPAANCFL